MDVTSRLIEKPVELGLETGIFPHLMLLNFTKMNGAGNDFLFIDNREGKVQLSPEQVMRLCHRQRGVGADGLFLLVPCTSGKADWAWQFDALPVFGASHRSSLFDPISNIVIILIL